jgi:SAM-dependent methyltransferase
MTTGITISRKLNVGCGADIREGWINLDVAALPGVDVVHNLEQFPWPFEDSAFDEIVLINVLEHLSDTVAVMEELHRISAPNGSVRIRVPYWNSPDAISDPTHKRSFNEHTFDFFDPNTRSGRERAYYSKARFHIEELFFYKRVVAGLPYARIRIQPFKAMMIYLARRMGGIIWVEEVVLRTIK